jgi:hypothetical protein
MEFFKTHTDLVLKVRRVMGPERSFYSMSGAFFYGMSSAGKNGEEL